MPISFSIQNRFYPATRPIRFGSTQQPSAAEIARTEVAEWLKDNGYQTAEVEIQVFPPDPPYRPSEKSTLVINAQDKAQAQEIADKLRKNPKVIDRLTQDLDPKVVQVGKELEKLLSTIQGLDPVAFVANPSFVYPRSTMIHLGDAKKDCSKTQDIQKALRSLPGVVDKTRPDFPEFPVFEFKGEDIYVMEAQPIPVAAFEFPAGYELAVRVKP